MSTVARILATTIASLAALAGVSAALAQTPWRHAIIQAKSDAGFQVMALRAGFAQKAGLDLKHTYMQNDVVMLRAMLAGELDSYEGTPGPALVAGSRNAGIKIIGCQWQAIVHSVFARTELKSAADMKGATMAISSPHAAPDMIAKAWLTQNNVPLSEVKFASLGGDPDRYKAVASGVSSSRSSVSAMASSSSYAAATCCRTTSGSARSRPTRRSRRGATTSSGS